MGQAGGAARGGFDSASKSAAEAGSGAKDVATGAVGGVMGGLSNAGEGVKGAVCGRWK